LGLGIGELEEWTIRFARLELPQKRWLVLMQVALGEVVGMEAASEPAALPAAVFVFQI